MRGVSAMGSGFGRWNMGIAAGMVTGMMERWWDEVVMGMWAW